MHDYDRIAEAIRFVEANFRSQPTLAELAAASGLSEAYFQRLFKRWAGISPKRFLQFLTVEYAKEQLAAERSVLETTYEAGLSSPSRLHDLFVTTEAITPDGFRQRGAGWTLEYGLHASPFGPCGLVTSGRGICRLDFVETREEDWLATCRAEWPAAEFVSNPPKIAGLVERVFRPECQQQPFHLWLQGTNFQLQVWQALLRIPPGEIVSYQEIASSLGQPTAARAVGTAVGQNRTGFLVPCHRVLRSNGLLSHYRWGQVRKRAMLAWEAGQYRESDEQITADFAAQAGCKNGA